MSLLLPGLNSSAQIAHGGSPPSWSGEMKGSKVPELDLGPLSKSQIEEFEHDALGSTGPVRYGLQRFMDLDILALGEWTDLEDGSRICRYRVRSSGAAMISLQFDVFDPEDGGRLFIYDRPHGHLLGSFTEANELPTGGLATAVIPGGSATIEYVTPPLPSKTKRALHLASITHGVRDIFHFGVQGEAKDYWPGYSSANCHNNVACPSAAAWQDQASSVAMFLTPQGIGCSGSMVNNTLQDGTPYFYFAQHCFQSTIDQWVFYFNYEAPACVGDTGITNQTVTGSSLVATDYWDDFVLVELFNAPPPSYNVFYAGWDRSGSQPQNQTVIHHPLFDVKKITFDYDPATSYYLGPPYDLHLWKNYWDSGIVQAVSSGAPLFDHNKRIIGHMNEGAQDCTNSNTVFTGCAKFNYSWDGTSPTTRLRDWLDPSNTSMTLNGFYPNAAPAIIRISPKVFLEGPYNTGNGLMSDALRTQGLIPLTEPFTGLGFTHVGEGGGETTTGAVLNVSGNNAVVDWIFVELRDKNSNTTIISTRSALLLRNGNVVSTDGTSPVSFNLAEDDYYVTIKHRNHLGIMTQFPQALTGSAASINLTNGSISYFGGSAAVKNLSGVRVMWMGDAKRDALIKYTGSDNDRDMVLATIGGSIPTNTIIAYSTSDTNMDGVVKYSGSGNDRDPILVNIGGAVPTNSRAALLP